MERGLKKRGTKKKKGTSKKKLILGLFKKKKKKIILTGLKKNRPRKKMDFSAFSQKLGAEGFLKKIFCLKRFNDYTLPTRP